MNKGMRLSIYVGVLLMAITLIIFFVPNFGEEKTDMQYAKLGFLILSEAVVIASGIFLAKGKNTFLGAGLTAVMALYFIVNFLFIVTMNNINLLITCALVLNLMLVILVLVIVHANSQLDKKSKEINKDINTPKGGSSF